jgi:hypothetical protein
MDPDNLANIRKQFLRAGKVVVIQDAFIWDFAEAMHYDLSRLNFPLQERYDPSG